jgi:hypothetical protein
MSIDRDLLIAVGRVGGRLAISALGGALDEAGVLVKTLAKSADTEAQRRIARAKAKLERMKRREAAAKPIIDAEFDEDGNDGDGNPYGV